MLPAVLLVLAAAAVVGFLARHRVLGRHGPDHALVQTEGLKVSELVIPVRTVATLVLAFVLVAVFQSYQEAGTAAATEAGAVLAMGEEAVLLTPGSRQAVLGRLTCYARSVAASDWRTQADDLRPSPQTDAAADALAVALQGAAADPRDNVALGAMLSSNATRIQTRIERLAQARPSVPALVWVLLLVTLAATVGGLAVLGHPGARDGVQFAVLAGTTVIFALALTMIYDLDRPYDGLARVEPVAMTETARRIAVLSGGEATVPCDADGTSPPR